MAVSFPRHPTIDPTAAEKAIARRRYGQRLGPAQRTLVFCASVFCVSLYFPQHSLVLMRFGKKRNERRLEIRLLFRVTVTLAFLVKSSAFVLVSIYLSGASKFRNFCERHAAA